MGVFFKGLSLKGERSDGKGEALGSFVVDLRGEEETIKIKVYKRQGYQILYSL